MQRGGRGAARSGFIQIHRCAPDGTFVELSRIKIENLDALVRESGCLGSAVRRTFSPRKPERAAALRAQRPSVILLLFSVLNLHHARVLLQRTASPGLLQRTGSLIGIFRPV